MFNVYCDEVNVLLDPLQHRRRRQRRCLFGDVLASLGNGFKNIVNSACEFIFCGVDDAASSDGDETKSNGVGRNPSLRTLQDDAKVLKRGQ
jgi:hypothetical protein